MDTGFKHFSHAHNLAIHQSHEAANMSCTACNLLAMGTIYACWQCNFILHDQCFRATRSLNHPSHPSHPLTLVPYPTYPSNSFYCNSCKLTGTGLSYSCSDCEFDLHVHCAHSISNASHSQAMIPQSGQNGYANSTSAHNPITNPQYSSMVPNMPVEQSASDRERIRENQQTLEIASEEYRIGALANQYALSYI
ncbi:hypothetical protein LXL04_010423 [Taraxacum kok-saghyz]